ncbi:hypothetical protein IGS68_35030 (plasmid) [Skermanella sp. TT6]|uniref:Calcium-binding protein n=1 Tax=Skermanella cutis TaxID=2775420 RepID=A0ABX7BNS4_9PROT|nr:calcium-binding protein [Skermanella sp. TT6]QQP93993.1 hypothetical protein IGS68_35030 [Skermanella sp. TT6]
MATKTGTARNDTLWGTSSADLMTGGAGDDYLNGQGGNDRMRGDDGNDKLDGGSGNDTINGSNGIDAVFGGAGDDYLHGDAGDDYVDGGIGNDAISGGLGNDRLRGGDGNDRFDLSGLDNDDVRGGNGNDLMTIETGGLVREASGFYFGDAGNDTLNFHMHGVQITSWDGEGVPATVSVVGEYMGQAGTIGYTDQISEFVQIGEIAGFERFTAIDGTQLRYSGGDKAATVIAADGDDVLRSGSLGDTFDGGAGRDQFFMDYGKGIDRLVNFDAAEDVIVTEMWGDSQGDPIANRTITEANGHTIVKTTSFSGTVLHTLDIDAVGLPRDVFKDGFSWDGFQS